MHTAFLTPHAIHRQYSVFPDGRTYFCFAKVIAEPLAGSLARGTVYAIGLGTHASDAKHLAYADDMPFVLDAGGSGVDPGGALEVRVTLASGARDGSPRVHEVGVEWECPAAN